MADNQEHSVSSEYSEKAELVEAEPRCENRRNATDMLENLACAAEGCLVKLGPIAHLTQVFAYDDFLAEDGVWRLMPVRPAWSFSRTAGLAVEYAAEKLLGAHQLINLFQDSDVPSAGTTRRVSIQPERGATDQNTDQPAPNGDGSKRGSTSSAFPVHKRTSAGLAGLLSSASKKAAEDLCLDDKRQAIESARNTLRNIKREIHAMKSLNRLDCALTEMQVHRICSAMYNKIGADDETVDTATIKVGSVEGMLMGWDLTSQIQGAWRIPLTLTTFQGSDFFNSAWTVLFCDQHVGALGRNASEKTRFFPLKKQKVSDVLRRLAVVLAERGRRISQIYLGLPSPCPPPLHECDHPLNWRHLKLDCAKQSWLSILATCDYYCCRRLEVRRAHLEHGPFPSGLSPLESVAGRDRIKASHPLLCRRKRPIKLKKDPPVDTSDAGAVSAEVWEASHQELSRVRAVAPAEAWGIPVIRSTTRPPAAPSVRMSTMFADITRSKPPVEQKGTDSEGPGYLRTVFGEEATAQDETNFGIDKHFVCEDCSSVSTTSLDDWLEDGFLDDKIWEVDLEPKYGPPNPLRVVPVPTVVET